MEIRPNRMLSINGIGTYTPNILKQMERMMIHRIGEEAKTKEPGFIPHVPSVMKFFAICI